jgi:hypothetical protein
VDKDILDLQRAAAQTAAAELMSDREVIDRARKSLEEYESLSTWRKFVRSFSVPKDIRRSEAVAVRLANEGAQDLNKPLPWFVYDVGKETSLKDHLVRFRALHVGIKYRLFRPLMFFLNRYLKKHYAPPPDYPYNRSLIAFDKAFDRAILEWHIHFLRSVYSKSRIHPKLAWFYTSKGFAGSDLKTIKEIYLSVCMMDTAYKEFHNMLMFNLTREMVDEYKTDIERDGVVKHLLYTTNNPFDASYFYIHKCLKTVQQKFYSVDKAHCCDDRNRERRENLERLSKKEFWGFELNE